MDKTVITIVGLGQIGTSIGLALEKHSERLHRVGHTRQLGQANHAKKLGAIDNTALNLRSAVRNADVVVLALPLDQVQEVLELISDEIGEGTVVLDTSLGRQAASEWAVDRFADGSHYVGFTPVLNPQMLQTYKGGIQEASPTLFQDGMFAITSPMNTSSDALKVASDLALMMDATPLFADLVEIDSYMSRVHVLPQLLAAGLANATIGTPGWDENRKLTGRAYSQLANIMESHDRAEAVALAARLNREHVVRTLDSLIAELGAMRDELESEDEEAFEGRILKADEARREWWAERRQVKWISEGAGDLDFSQVGGTFGQLFGYGRPRKEKDKK